MGEILGRPVIVENKPGGNARVGVMDVIHAAPNGYRLLAYGAATMIPEMNKDLDINILDQLEPVGHTNRGRTIMYLVNKEVPARTLADLIAYLKANPGKLNYAYTSPVTLLQMEQFKKLTGTDVVAVRYPSAGACGTALASNQVQIYVDSLLAHQAHVDAGNVFPIAVLADQRAANAPIVPTTVEAGYPDLKAVTNGGIWAPMGTPAAVIERLSTALQEAGESPEVNERLSAAGMEVPTSAQAEFRATVREEMAMYKQQAALIGYQPE